MKLSNDFQMNVRDALASRHEPEAQRMLARMYWSALVSLSIVVAIASLSFGLWQFFWAPSSSETIVNARPQAAFTKVQLQTVLEGFDARAQRFDERMVAPISVKDPS